ncbi:homoserine O-acetyltransferase [Paenarthrobacter sp. PH39-S1]|uniref:homoserine O-acetyltransferase MetX n=1 Tax=Paenarthrobacter sp. PH39-S1 TaxID=3046204 RepID=UPI0024B9F403|nr:homoserine O-acetyltransferase [Paenarthrobacter sp. PH39-S1]MDJ0357765.1 homoserine O-acetyltransferase [Paenarthrobacter sp. PH39-S1]
MPAGAPTDSPTGTSPLATADGEVKYARIGDLDLEAGGRLPDVTVAYETWGTLNAEASNAVLIAHALTGSTHVSRGGSAEDGWWEGLVGPGRVIDTDRYFVVSPNMLGGCYGSTGPSSIAPDGRPWGSRFPFVTIRDSVQAEARLADQLDIGSWYAVIGGSMGGARALEWAVTLPARVRRCAVVAACAASTAEQIAFAQAQVLAIRLDPDFAGGDYYDGAAPVAGLGLARRIAHITYRSEPEMSARFGRSAQPGEAPVSQGRIRNIAGSSAGERYQVESYLDHQAHKLARRFDANSYIVITEALMSHDVCRGRGPLLQALEQAADVEFLVAAVASDRLYFPAQSDELAAALPGEVGVDAIESEIGHDGFLTETEAVGVLLRRRFFGNPASIGELRPF